MQNSTKLTLGLGAALLLIPSTFPAGAPIACDPDNGGLKLPPGPAANGDLYVALMNGGVEGLPSSKGDGHFDVVEKFGEGSTTGIKLRGGYFYVAKMNSVERYKMTAGQLKPADAPDVVVSGA